MYFDHSSGQYVELADARIYFEIIGNPVGHPVVLLHGGLGSLADFNVILDRLPKKLRYIGIDFRGHGRSTLGSEPLSYSRYQADVAAVLAHIGVGAVSVVGFSDGGIVGYRLAADHKTQVTDLFTLGAQWRLEPDDPSLPMLAGVTNSMWEEMFPQSVEYYRRVNPQPAFETLVQAVVQMWTDTSCTGYPKDLVETIGCPTLIVRGDSDHLFSIGEAVSLQERISNASLLNIPFAGHAAHEDSVELFSLALSDFLQNARKKQDQD